MSVPSSLKVGPNTTLILVKKRYLIFYIFLIWISLFTIQFEFWLLWKLYEPKFIHFLFFLPLLVVIMYLTSILVSLIFAKLMLTIVNIIHKPQEGVFLRHHSDKDYRYWSLRSTIKKWPLWLSHKFPFPFMNNICSKMFGVKTKISNSLFEGWVDTEFIEFGKNIVVGQGAVVQSALIVGNLFIIKKTIIEDNVVIGSQSVVMPGTHMKKNSILGGHSMTTVGQEIEVGFIYLGAPAKKFKKNVFLEDGLEEIIREQGEKEIKSKASVEELYTVRKDKETKNE
jgi:carbonic anhydrase/acetyltransferase-like protein (isoleucine patch superfamily)